MALNLLLALAVIIAVPAATPAEFQNSANLYVFGSFINQTSWPNGFAFILSFFTPIWTLSGLDSMVHISEEAKNANIAIPYGIMFATVSSVVLGWGVNVALAFCKGTDLQNILSDNQWLHLSTRVLFEFVTD